MDSDDEMIITKTPKTTIVESNSSETSNSTPQLFQRSTPQASSTPQSSSMPQSSESLNPSFSSAGPSAPNNSFHSMGEKVAKKFSYLSIGKYILIILLLAFLGFNIFAVLGKVTDKTTGILGKTLPILGYGVGETVKKTVDTTAKGAKLGVDVAAGAVDDAVNLIEKGAGVKDVKFNRIDNNNVSTEKALASAKKK